MKYLLSLSLLIVLSINSIAQEDKNTIAFDFFRPLISDPEINRFLITYERALNEKFTALIGFETGNYEHSSMTINNDPIILYTVEGSGLLLEGRFFPFFQKKEAPRGLFVGAFFKNYWLNEKNTNDNPEYDFEEKQSVQALGIGIGYKFFKGWFILEPVLGFGKTWSSGLGEDDRISPIFPDVDLSTYSLRAAISVGVCF